MWLINIETLELESFMDEPPKYAILSHRWGPEEITFQEWRAYTTRKKRAALDPDGAAFLLQVWKALDTHTSAKDTEEKEGYAKIIAASACTRNLDLKYLWVDTNCIDKTSSAELSEAINSMFAYYQKAQVCIAYLNDVPYYNGKDYFDNSLWFTRGWTLQELLAPRKLEFFSTDWRSLGQWSSWVVNMSSITGIRKSILDGNPPRTFLASVAEKMSWVSNRVTTRIEDIAYCMLGILGVNMPLLYGEGERAFLRLQEHIIASSSDTTIFAWNFIPESYLHADQLPAELESHFPRIRFKYLKNRTRSRVTAQSLLALDPINFWDAGTLISLDNEVQKPYSLTNIGLSITLDVLEEATSTSYIALLPCSNKNGDVLCILLNNSDNLDTGRCLRETFIETLFFMSLASCPGWISEMEDVESLKTSTELYVTTVEASVFGKTVKSVMSDPSCSYAGIIPIRPPVGGAYVKFIEAMAPDEYTTSGYDGLLWLELSVSGEGGNVGTIWEIEQDGGFSRRQDERLVLVAASKEARYPYLSSGNGRETVIWHLKRLTSHSWDMIPSPTAHLSSRSETVRAFHPINRLLHECHSTGAEVKLGPKLLYPGFPNYDVRLLMFFTPTEKRHRPRRDSSLSIADSESEVEGEWDRRKRKE